MKRLFIFVLLACMLTVSAAAAFIPDNEVCENRDGRQLIIKTYTLSPGNDPGYVPKTTVKNGRTLTLASVEWSVQGTGLSGDTLVATQYMAIATYTGSASSKTADGYITTAVYTGEIVSSGIASIEYTVTYLGEPVSAPEPEPEQEPASDADGKSLVWYFVGAGAVLLLAAAIRAAREDTAARRNGITPHRAERKR